MADPATWMVILAGSSLGLGVVNSFRGAPNLPAPPQPASSYQYAKDGSVTVQRWDQEKNAYITEHDPEPTKGSEPKFRKEPVAPDRDDEKFYFDNDESGGRREFRPDRYRQALEAHEKDKLEYDQYLKNVDSFNNSDAEWQEWKLRDDKTKANTKLRDEMKAKFTGFLNETPEERKAQYKEWSDNYVSTMRDEINPEFTKRAADIEAQNEATGRTGTSFHAQTVKDHQEIVAKTNVAIERQGVGLQQEFEQADRANALNVLGFLESSGNAEVAREQAKVASNQINTAGANTFNLAQQNIATAKSAFDFERRQNQSQQLLDTAGGLAFLYGYNRPGGGSAGITPRSGGGTSSFLQRPTPQPGNPRSFF